MVKLGVLTVSTGWDNVNNKDTTTPDLYTGEAPLKSAHNTWTKVQGDLAYALGANVHRSWTGRLRVNDACPGTVTLVAPSKFVASKIETNYSDTVTRLWKKHDVVAPPRKVIIAAPISTGTHKAETIQSAAVIRPTKRKYNARQNIGHKPKNTRVASHTGQELATPDLPHIDLPSHAPASQTAPLVKAAEPARRRFTFENFVVGPSNELAHAVARQIAGEAMPSYNPIVIHGQNGMGKTHLLYAVKQAIEDNFIGRRVHFLSSEEFVNNFVRSVRNSGRDAIESFKSSLRDVDLLIIDDAHFIADKPGSQEELLHTLVSLVDAGRQILLASDRHPDHIEKASDRLKSYLSSGLVCKIGSADYELRLRILDRLIDRRSANGQPNLAIPKNARDLLAAKINATPRDLEGAFNQVIAQAEFLGTPITLESVQDTLSDSRYTMGQRLTVDKIQRVTADTFSITLDDMTSKRRSRNVARPRQVAMYLCKKLTKRSLPDIGRRFGGRDHTTVMHAVKRIESLRAEDPALNTRIEAVESALKS